jgi:glycosyltransferase involved in cell wall biosynthesis
MENLSMRDIMCANDCTLSVVIPAYNCEKTLSDTVKSILNQQCKDIEIIIVNDGSIDNTEKIALDFNNKYKNIKYISKHNTGVADTRNVGIKSSKGKYIAFLDSDDVWDKDYYDNKLHSDILENNADIFVFSSCFSDINLNIVEEVRIKTEKLTGGDKAVDTFYHSFCSFIFRKDFLIKNDIYFPINLRYGEDEVFRSKCLYLADYIIAQDKMSFYYRDNPYSSTKMNRKYKLFAKQKLEAYYELKNFFYNEYKKKNEDVFVKNATTVKYFADAIQLLSESGYGFKNIEELCNKENLKLMYQNSEKYYTLYYTILDRMKNYLENPKRFYLKNKLHGMWYYKAVDLKHRFMRR